MRFNWKKLYSDIDKAKSESWRSLAKQVGVTPSVFTRISQGKPVSVANLAKLLDYSDHFAFSLKPYVR